LDKKEKLLQKMEELQKQLNAIEEKQAKKISKIAMKYGLGDFSEKVLDKEFMLLAKKLSESEEIDAKKNVCLES